MESMYQTRYLLAGPRDELRWFGIVMDPAMSKITHTRAMTEYTSRSGRAIYDVDIGPTLCCCVNISSAQKIVREVLLHIFLSSSGNGQVSADPIADLCRQSAQGYRQRNWSIKKQLQVRGQKTVRYAGRYQEQDGQNPDEPR